MEAAFTVATEVGIKPACASLDIPRCRFYRVQARKSAPATEPKKRPSHPRALSFKERNGMLDILHSDRFVDKAPNEVYADHFWMKVNITVLYVPCTAYFDDNQEVRERRNQLSHPAYQKPELLATAPNQVWSWDISAP